MVLKQLKQISHELKSSAENYDTAFRNTALIAAGELSDREQSINSKPTQLNLTPALDKEYFIAKYGSLKNAKTAYQKKYGKQKYGRSWSDFIAVAKTLTLPEPQLTKSEEAPCFHRGVSLTLEERVARIENFLSSLGYQL